MLRYARAVSDPFRDGMEAALRRSETLEEENELLREEIARIRQQATALKEVPHATPETHALADQALGVLDQLEALSKRPDKVRVALGAYAHGEMRPLDAVIPAPAEPARASEDVIVVPKPKPPTRPERPPATGVSPGNVVFLVLLASFFFFYLGVMVASGHR